ncbi:MAG: hypothetical protein UX23_C0001G0072 [Parcubacteria group bacterium GW2011_GWB1_45_9]|nr:MAG: hypothetical protein UX23_C0001G0072 [Parcubacteria group bacterium GW2011_GWB1_45_9]
MRKISTTDIKFLFEPETMADLLLAVHHNPVEISGLAKVQKENGLLYVVRSEPEIFEQECGMSFTDFDIKTYHSWHSRMLKENYLQEISEMRLWWHSHVWGNVYFSGTDKDTISSFGRGFEEWWASLVLNKYGEFCLWLNTKPEWEYPFQIDEIGFTREIEMEEFRSIMVERSHGIKTAIEKKVRVKQLALYESIISGLFKPKKEPFWDNEPHRRRL